MLKFIFLNMENKQLKSRPLPLPLPHSHSHSTCNSAWHVIAVDGFVDNNKCPGPPININTWNKNDNNIIYFKVVVKKIGEKMFACLYEQGEGSHGKCFCVRMNRGRGHMENVSVFVWTGGGVTWKMFVFVRTGGGLTWKMFVFVRTGGGVTWKTNMDELRNLWMSPMVIYSIYCTYRKVPNISPLPPKKLIRYYNSLLISLGPFGQYNT